jgi:23S rRNA pseudouridine1911/1915/1917 synthase
MEETYLQEKNSSLPASEELQDGIGSPEELQDELYEHLRIQADPGQSLMRVDKFLLIRIENASRNRIQNAIKAGTVLLNGKTVKPSYKVKPGDQVSVVLPTPPREFEIIPQDLPLDVVYEDEDVLVVDKKPGMVAHPGYGNWDGTLVNALAFRYGMDEESKSTKAYLVHRIDKDTSGLLVVARNEWAQTFLAKQFFEHTIERRYLALVWGEPADSGRIEGHIGRSARDRRVMAVFEDGSHGKEAVTHFSVVERFGYVTLIECRLETGRTHQIRAHLRHIGHPLFGDITYGGDRILKGAQSPKFEQFVKNSFQILNRQALHARSLGFIHPTTLKDVNFSSPLPSDFKEILDRWRRYTGASGQGRDG